ncbi:MAG TPA: hypothetical protein VKR99_00110 [Candidatus Eremiobacteraceae bacterium]|nr:hypothetical protein [Candidatus Eremiobacteraceae bacterium]
MRTAAAWAAALAGSIVMAAAAHAQALQPLDVVQHVAAQNAGLQSYTARATFDVDLHAFVSIHPTLHATYYYKRPDRAEVVFDTMPVLAEQFEHLYAALATADKWPATYNIHFTAAPAPGKPYELTMTPKKEGNVDRVLVTVDPQSFAINRMEWRYKNGSWIIMQQTNAKVGNYLLPVGQVGDFNLPSYKAHAVSSYSDYQINVPIPDSVFTK